MTLRIRPTVLCAVLFFAGVHGAAHAGLVKCKKPGGGYAYQDRACPPAPGAPEVKRPVVGEKDPSFSHKSSPSANWDRRTPFVMENKAPMAQPAPVPRLDPAAPARAAVAAPKDAPAREPKPGGDYLSRKAEEERLAHNEQVKAQNKALECSHARQQLEVANTQRRISTRDGKGEKQYIKDEDRPGIVAGAERAVAQACN